MNTPERQPVIIFGQDNPNYNIVNNVGAALLGIYNNHTVRLAQTAGEEMPAGSSVETFLEHTDTIFSVEVGDDTDEEAGQLDLKNIEGLTLSIARGRKLYIARHEPDKNHRKITGEAILNTETEDGAVYVNKTLYLLGKASLQGTAPSQKIDSDHVKLREFIQDFCQSNGRSASDVSDKRMSEQPELMTAPRPALAFSD